MRRLMLAVAVTAALTLSVAAPAVAAPEKNPYAFEVTVVCPSGTWDVITTGKVGWQIVGPTGAIGVLMGGTHHFTDELGVTHSVDYATPRGLADKLQECTIDRPGSWWGPAYILMTPNSPS